MNQGGNLLTTKFIEQRFWIECRKTKTKVNTKANQSKGKYYDEPIGEENLG